MENRKKKYAEWEYIPLCPANCGRELGKFPALSRRDNETYICSPCGTREALEDMGIDDNK
jgi:predicted RNA-binding Zn-ribbon protein involved in translation (DUF1610 family)